MVLLFSNTFSCVLIIVFSSISGANCEPTDCCSFDFNQCGKSVEWQWSAQYPPTSVPITSGNYMWSNSRKSLWVSDVYVNVSATTQFTLRYLLQAEDNAMSISLKRVGNYSEQYIVNLFYLDGRWRGYSFSCSSCCAPETTCDVQILLETNYNDAIETAFDMVERDNACLKSQCCDFSSTSCAWDSSNWKNSQLESPDLGLYPSFITTQTDPYYTYIEDQSGSTKSSSTFYIPKNGTILYLDFFFDSPILGADTYFYIEFYNVVRPNPSIRLATITTTSATWRQAQITCNEASNYCCGSADLLPCSGQLEIVTNVDVINPQALFAIDNVGTACTSAPTPSPNCCSFESDECGSFSDGQWLWSAEDTPTNITGGDGNFEWTNRDYVVWESDYQMSVSNRTLFTLQYYIVSQLSQLRIDFTESYSKESYILLYAYNVGGGWTSLSFYCIGCCRISPTCVGQLFITAYNPDENEVAIDNIGRDRECGINGFFSCCLFDDSTICDFVYDNEYGYQWKFSGNYNPTYNLPSPGSDFVYFESVTYSEPFPLSVGLRSKLMTINIDTIFRGNVFAYNPNAGTMNNTFSVHFMNMANGMSTQLSSSIISTDSQWLIMDFNCDSILGNCCQAQPYCTGYIDFVAAVDAVGGEVLFAVDAFEIKGSCTVFPA